MLLKAPSQDCASRVVYSSSALRRQSLPCSIVLNITTLLELDLKLQEPSIPPFPLTGPGGDTRAAKISLPVTITIRGGASGAGTITHASDASLRAYGTLANLTFAAGAAHYNPHINRILVPYKTDAHDFSPIPAAGPEPAPIGLVLRNLFLKTTGPLGFFVFGKGALSGQDIAVDAGVVLIAFRRLLSIPMLPDPYAASFDYVATGGRIADGGVRVATSTPDLVAVVELTPPADAVVRMILLPQTPGGTSTTQLPAGIVSRPQTSPGARFFAAVQGGPDPGTTRFSTPRAIWTIDFQRAGAIPPARCFHQCRPVRCGACDFPAR